MLIVRPNSDGTFTELPPRDVVVGSGVNAITIPWTNFALWSSKDSKPYGLYVVMTPPAPQGKRRVSYGFAWNSDKSDVVYQPVYEDDPQSIPQTLSRRQMMLALLAQNLLSTVTSIVTSLPLATQIAWNEASYFDRNDALLLQMAAAQGWTTQQLDDLFVNGAKL